MAMIGQLSLLIRVSVVVFHDGVVFAIVLLVGEGSSTIADAATTGGGDNQTMSLLSRRRHHRRNSQPRTISTIIIKVRTHALRTIAHNRNKYVKCTV